MKKGTKRILIFFAVLVVILTSIWLTVFLLAKQKKIFINKWFVNEKNSTIGVDVSSYQADIDMDILKEQNIRFIYIKATEGSSTQDDRFAQNWENDFTWQGTGASEDFTVDLDMTAGNEQAFVIEVGNITFNDVGAGLGD